MLQSTTRLITFRRLALKGDLASTLVRLMMALNDVTLANDALATWHGTQAISREHRQVGAKMYFVRLRIAHIYEAFFIIKDILKTPALLAAVKVCDAETQKSFEKIVSFIGTEDYKKIMLLVRNKVTFHYDNGLVEKAIGKIAEAHPDAHLTISLGRDSIDWYFEPGDRIIDRIIVRDIFNVAIDADVHVEVDKIVARLDAMTAAFADFAGYFIRFHTKRS